MTESKAQHIATIRDALFFFTESNVRHYSGSCASKRQGALVALGRLESLTHPEAQGNKDLGEPALRALKEDAIYVLTDLIESQEYDILPWVRTCLRGVRQNVRALSCSSERSEAAPTSPQPIKGDKTEALTDAATLQGLEGL